MCVRSHMLKGKGQTKFTSFSFFFLRKKKQETTEDDITLVCEGNYLLKEETKPVPKQVQVDGNRSPQHEISSCFIHRNVLSEICLFS